MLVCLYKQDRELPARRVPEALRNAAAEFRWLRTIAGGGVADHLRAIRRKDGAGEKQLGAFQSAERANRDLTAAAQRRQHAAFGGDGQAGPRVVERSAGIEALAVGARFDRKRPLR